MAADEASVKELDKLDPLRSKVPLAGSLLSHSSFVSPQIHNILQILGLKECANTVVGDGMLRGISGGQKRRVTVGEMMIPPKAMKFMDAVSNGLDASTTFDIFRALRFITETLGYTCCVSLLQVPPPPLLPLLPDARLSSLHLKSSICLTK
jgi:ABC-type Mn2+/Zn2+ transport system ATPase subunit